MSVIYLDQYGGFYDDTYGIARLELAVASVGPDRTLTTRAASRTVDSLGPDRSISTRVRSS